MADPRLASRNSSILLVAVITLVAFGAWQLLKRLRRENGPSELEWWLAGFSLIAFELTTLATMVFR